jgi:hypothetical protein
MSLVNPVRPLRAFFSESPRYKYRVVKNENDTQACDSTEAYLGANA